MKDKNFSLFFLLMVLLGLSCSKVKWVSAVTQADGTCDKIDLSGLQNTLLTHPNSLIALNLPGRKQTLVFVRGGIKLSQNNIPSSNITKYSIKLNNKETSINQLREAIKNEKQKWNILSIEGDLNDNVIFFEIPKILDAIKKYRTIKMYSDSQGACIKVLFKK